MKTKTLFLVAFLVAVSTIQINAQEVESVKFDFLLNTILKRNVPETDVKTLAKSADEYIILDAREKREYEVSHLPNAVWVGYHDFDMNRVNGIDPSKKIVVYCSVGARSENVAEKLIENGFTNVQNLYGGIFEWVNEEKPVYDTKGKPTEKIHAFENMWKVWLDRGEIILD